MNLTLVDQITKKQLKSDIPVFKAGDTLKVYVKIKEGNKYRIQLFEGVFITGRSGVRVPVGAPKKKVLKRVLSFYFTVMREQGLEGER